MPARIVPFATLALTFLLFALLYAFAPLRVYARILHAWGFHVWEFPFLDTDTVLSAVRCLRKGVDVFVANPCDPLERVYDYSPLWLLLAYLPMTPAWTAPIGLIVDLAFILSLLLLPAGRSPRAALAIAAGAISSAVLYALERGNNDLVLFVLAVGAARLVCRSPALRALGYALALLAGLLKYYPMTLMALAVRERPRGFALAVAGSVAGVALFLLTMGHDLQRALRLIPIGPWYEDMFGASTLPGGLGAAFGWSPATTLAVRIALALGAMAAGIALAASRSFVEDLRLLDERERSFLLAGALMVLGCFFTAQNIGYRGTHLLLVLPSLTALAVQRVRWRLPAGVALALLWSIGWRHWIEQLAQYRPGVTTAALRWGVHGGLWGVRECLWWIIVSVLIGCVAALLAQSTIVRSLWPRGAVRRRDGSLSFVP